MPVQLAVLVPGDFLYVGNEAVGEARDVVRGVDWQSHEDRIQFQRDVDSIDGDDLAPVLTT